VSRRLPRNDLTGINKHSAAEHGWERDNDNNSVGGLGDNAHRSNAGGLGRGNLERNHAADRDNRYNDAGGRDDNVWIQ
jgi:hypothetical protein